MLGTFVIWVEDQWGDIVRAFTWRGRAKDGIARALADARARGVRVADVWATPVANTNIEV